MPWTDLAVGRLWYRTRHTVVWLVLYALLGDLGRMLGTLELAKHSDLHRDSICSRAVHQNACWLGREMRDCIYSPSLEPFLELACLSNALFLILPTCLPWPTSLPVCFSLFKSSSCLLNDWDAVQSGRPISFIHLPIEIQFKFSVIYIWRSYLKLFTKKNVWLESFPEMFFFSVFGSSVVSHERCQLPVPRTSKCHHLCKCLQCD